MHEYNISYNKNTYTLELKKSQNPTITFLKPPHYLETMVFVVQMTKNDQKSFSISVTTATKGKLSSKHIRLKTFQLDDRHQISLLILSELINFYSP